MDELSFDQPASAEVRGFVHHVKPTTAWEQLFLKEEPLSSLQQIISDFKDKTNITCLFTGQENKMMRQAAKALANALGKDLYQVDLDAVINKYIGETEKNLRKLLDRAEEGGALLFFDEADALFGKRSEVKDSHDRYANIEINYLLQLIRDYPGIAILATNQDQDCLSEIRPHFRHVIDFPE